MYMLYKFGEGSQCAVSVSRKSKLNLMHFRKAFYLCKVRDMHVYLGSSLTKPSDLELATSATVVSGCVTSFI